MAVIKSRNDTDIPLLQDKDLTNKGLIPENIELHRIIFLKVRHEGNHVYNPKTRMVNMGHSP